MTQTLDPVSPFDTNDARDHSTYAAYVDGKLSHILTPEQPVSGVQEFVHDSFRALVLNPKFACVAARGAYHRGSYRIGLYSEMASPEATAGLAHDLYAFLQDQDAMEERGEGFSTFVASFQSPCVFDEEIFERLLWNQLQALHERDAPHHAWAEGISHDPEDAKFGFSLGGRGFYVIGLHPAASRWTRRFAWPTLVFNAHYQFDQLKNDGRYTPLQKAIRRRDTDLQGNTNAMLAEFGTRSEARQYSGRTVSDSWKCPFHHTGGNAK